MVQTKGWKEKYLLKGREEEGMEGDYMEGKGKDVSVPLDQWCGKTKEIVGEG